MENVKRLLRLGLAGLCILNLISPAWAWGAKGHKLIVSAALADLPPVLPAFLRHANTALRFLTNEPDRWRESGLTELNAENAPDHFINLERVPFASHWPRDRYGFIQALQQRAAALSRQGHPREAAQLAPAKVGFNPYAAIEYYQRLLIAFQEYRAARARHLALGPFNAHVIETMGLLSHYVGDGSQPLHTTIQYNGWIGPDPAGFTRSHRIHAYFETVFVNRAVPADALRGRLAPPRRLAHPFRAYLQYLRVTHTQVIPLYRLNRQGAFRGRGSAAGRHFVIARLAAGARMLADLVYTAWLNSARPPTRPLQF